MQTADNHRKEWHHGSNKSTATNGNTLDASANQVFNNHSHKITDQARIQREVWRCGSEKVFSEPSDLLPPCETCCGQCRKTPTAKKDAAQLRQESFTHENMNQHPQLQHPHPTNNKHEVNVSSKVDSPCSSSSSSNSSGSSSNSEDDDDNDNDHDDDDNDNDDDDDDDDADDDKKYQTSSSTIRDFNNGNLIPPTTLQPSCPGKSFQCDICGRSFTLVGNMQKHRKLHSGERPFSCDVCGRAFGLRGNLQKHKIIHTGVKLFHCAVCGKPFALRGNMQKHEIIHTGIRPFHCIVCDKRFTLRGNLQKHLLTHADGARDRKQFPCHQCNKNFPHNASLQNHIQSFHSETENSKHSYHSKVKSLDFDSAETGNETHRLQPQRR